VLERTEPEQPDEAAAKLQKQGWKAALRPKSSLFAAGAEFDVRCSLFDV
jgi:hypothetical protein